MRSDLGHILGQAIVYLLEQHRAQHGRYPATFNPATVRQPRRAQETILYYTTGDRFLLTFLRPTPINNFWVYDSAKQHWARSSSTQARSSSAIGE